MIAPWLWLSAGAADTPELGVVYGLEVDGRPVGTRELSFRSEGGEERVRVVSGWTELTVGEGRHAYTFRQRTTASTKDRGTASFVAVNEAGGATFEVQGRAGDGLWHISSTDAGGTKEQSVPSKSVDLSMIDLFDPESDRALGELATARVLSDVTGRVDSGAVVPLGPIDLPVGGEELWVEGFEWQSPQGPWRFFYASNGFLVRWEAPLVSIPGVSAPGKRLVGAMIGPAPLGPDEFPVAAPPVVEVLDL